MAEMLRGTQISSGKPASGTICTLLGGGLPAYKGKEPDIGALAVSHCRQIDDAFPGLLDGRRIVLVDHQLGPAEYVLVRAAHCPAQLLGMPRRRNRPGRKRIRSNMYPMT